MNLDNFNSALDQLSNEELIDRFNQEVGHSAWTSSRGSFLKALGQQFAKRGINFSLIGDDYCLSLKRKVCLKDLVILYSEPTENQKLGNPGRGLV